MVSGRDRSSVTRSMVVFIGSTTNNGDGRLTLLENGVNDCLNTLGSADTYFIIDRHTNQSKGLLRPSQTNHTTNRLGDTNVVHVTHKQHCLKSADVDALRKNGVVQNNKLLRGIFAPGIESVKKHLTIDFLTVNNTTSLSSDIHHRITTGVHFTVKIRLTQKFDDLLGRTSTNKNLIQCILINGIDKVLAVTISNHLLVLHHVKLLHNNLRGENVTLINQLRCRNIADHFTVHISIIHAWFEHRQRMLRSSSEEETPIRVSSKVLRRREKVTLNRVVCFIKVNGVDFNICLLNAMQRMIGSEDNHVLTSSPCSVSEQCNLLRFSSREVMSLTTVNVHDVSVLGIDNLKKLTAKLLSKQNTRSNHNSGHTVIDIFAILNNVHDHGKSLTTTSRNNDLTLFMNQHGIDGILLVGSQSDGHECLANMNIL